MASLTTLAREAAITNVTLLNVHGGHDGWGVADAVAYLTGALAIQDELGVPIAHEFSSEDRTRDNLKNKNKMKYSVRGSNS